VTIRINITTLHIIVACQKQHKTGEHLSNWHTMYKLPNIIRVLFPTRLPLISKNQECFGALTPSENKWSQLNFKDWNLVNWSSNEIRNTCTCIQFCHNNEKHALYSRCLDEWIKLDMIGIVSEIYSEFIFRTPKQETLQIIWIDKAYWWPDNIEILKFACQI
jgi:hypothetical protein